MTVYERITNKIESFIQTTQREEQSLQDTLFTCRGMIKGLIEARDCLTIEAAECVIF